MNERMGAGASRAEADASLAEAGASLGDRPLGDGSLVVAIDNGSQSTKVSIVDARGRVVARGRAALRPASQPAPGHVEHPDDDLWDSIVAACREAMANFDGDPARIVGVGLCTIRFCRALLDADGLLVTPVMSWMDARVSRPYEHVDERVAFVATSSGYLSGRLTGRPVEFAGNTQGRWPVDHDSWTWSERDDVIAAEGIPSAMLLPLAMPGDEIGRVTAAAAASTGIPAGLPVYATSNDKAVEALGCGLLEPDELLLSLGTYVATMTPGEGEFAPQAVPEVWRNFGAMPGSTLYESGGVRRGMWTVSWFRELVRGAWESADEGGGAGGAIAASGDANAGSAAVNAGSGAPAAALREDGALESLLEAEAVDVPPGCNGLVTVLDWLAPADEPHRRGAFIGFDGTQARGALYRSVIEALALTMADHARDMSEALGRTPRILIVSGGGARSTLFLRILAAAFRMPVRRTAMADAAGLGAAITAAVGAGVHASWRDAVEAMVRVECELEPEGELVAAYEPIARRHRAVREGVAELLRRVG